MIKWLYNCRPKAVQPLHGMVIFDRSRSAHRIAVRGSQIGAVRYGGASPLRPGRLLGNRPHLEYGLRRPQPPPKLPVPFHLTPACAPGSS